MKTNESVIKAITDAIDELAEIQHGASSIEYAARDAERALEEILGTALDADENVAEAARLGLPAMIAKYGHSSKEVQAVEKFISHKP